MFCTFWLANVLLATVARNFSTSQLQKVPRDRQFFNILTCKCASRYSGVQFFICPLNRYLRTRRFSEPTFRPSRPTNHWKNTPIGDFPNISRVWVFFLLTFAQLYLLSSDSTPFLRFFIFWLCFSALLFQLSILSEVRLLNFLWWNKDRMETNRVDIMQLVSNMALHKISQGKRPHLDWISWSKRKMMVGEILPGWLYIYMNNVNDVGVCFPEETTKSFGDYEISPIVCALLTGESFDRQDDVGGGKNPLAFG